MAEGQSRHLRGVPPARKTISVAPLSTRWMETLSSMEDLAATFQRMSVRNASIASRSDRPASDCSTINVAALGGGVSGRSRNCMGVI